MEVNIILTREDKEFADNYGLTDKEMRGFISDMRMADACERQAICKAESEKAEMLATPQGSVYDAW